MSDTESLSLSDFNDEEIAETSECKQTTFVRIVKDYPILLSKSQTPVVKKQKAAAMKKLIAEYQQRSGIQMTEKQVNKKLNNMKTDLRTKADRTATGNKPIELKKWEADLLDLIDAESNPTLSGNPGGMSVGLGTRRSSSVMLSRSTPDVEVPTNRHRQSSSTVTLATSGHRRNTSSTTQAKEGKLPPPPPPPKKKRSFRKQKKLKTSQ
ncbi:uncharacterized protein LOC135495090 [Lineus longissimus]|uniref:uncharacterized protein LOC135495090 n=1 Tax=Lineus longissimus TaxID=88925 RepID=UPI00315C94B4